MWIFQLSFRQSHGLTEITGMVTPKYQNDKPRAEKALSLIQQLYAVERKAKEEKLSAAQIKELRLAESLPIINELGTWIFEQIKLTLPKSQIGKAMSYAYARWDALSAYLYNGSLLIDNNLIENSIRPLALGRKNYLFAGSHDAARCAGMIYSFFVICKKTWSKSFSVVEIHAGKYHDHKPQEHKKTLSTEL